MQKNVMTIDLVKLARYILKRIWLVIICAVIGFSAMFYYVNYMGTDLYAAQATLYVFNGNPNTVNYQYVSSNDLSTAVELLNTYMVVVKSNKVMDSVAERLISKYPGISNGFIRSTLSMGSVSNTGVLKVICTTTNPQMSADICNAVLDVAPAQIIRVVGAGSVEVIDYALVPSYPESRGAFKKGVLGAMAGGVAAAALLVLLFLLNRKVTDSKELQNNYTPPIFSCIKRSRKESKDPSSYLLNAASSRDVQESYAKLRMNLMHALADRESNVIAIASAISGEGKSTIAANLAISCAMGVGKVLLIDGDMRRGCQSLIFSYDENLPGLSKVLMKEKTWQECIFHTATERLDVLPAGELPQNPAQLMSSVEMEELLTSLRKEYQLILIDVPPINIVSDPLILSDLVAGCIFAVRQNYSDHREIKRALIAAEMAKMEVLGFAFYGEKSETSGRYASRHYRQYYSKYDNQVKYRKTNARQNAGGKK